MIRLELELIRTFAQFSTVSRVLPGSSVGKHLRCVPRASALAFARPEATAAQAYPRSLPLTARFPRSCRQPCQLRHERARCAARDVERGCFDGVEGDDPAIRSGERKSGAGKAIEVVSAHARGARAGYDVRERGVCGLQAFAVGVLTCSHSFGSLLYMPVRLGLPHRSSGEKFTAAQSIISR